MEDEKIEDKIEQAEEEINQAEKNLEDLKSAEIVVDEIKTAIAENTIVQSQIVDAIVDEKSGESEKWHSNLDEKMTVLADQVATLSSSIQSLLSLAMTPLPQETQEMTQEQESKEEEVAPQEAVPEVVPEVVVEQSQSPEPEPEPEPAPRRRHRFI